MLSVKEIHVVEDKKNVPYVLICKYANNMQFLPADLILTRISVSYTGSIISLENAESTKDLLRDKDPSILTLEALTNNDNSNKFFFEIKWNERDINFMWKYSPASEVKILLGSVTLKHDDSSDTVLTTLKLLGERIRGLEKTHAELDKIQTELNEEQAKLLNTVEKYTTEKESFEKEMYTKFTMVLNSKKLKCKELKKTLNSMETRPDINLPTVSQSSNEGSTIQRRKKLSTGVKYLDSDNSDLDIPEASQFKRKIQPKKNPSKNSASSSKIPRQAVNEVSSNEDSYDADKLLDDI